MTEEWRAVPGFEGRYEVSSLGRVRSLDRVVRCGRGGKGRRSIPGVLLAPYQRKDFSYLTVGVGPETRLVHELVLLAFVGPCPPGEEARHLDCDGGNNCLDNLAWGTRGQNNRDTTAAGKRKLTYAQVDEIKKLARAGESHAKLGRKFGVSEPLIWQIIHEIQYVRHA